MADTELAALVVKLEADLKGFKADMQSAQTTVAHAGDKMTKAIEDFSKKSSGATFNFGRVLETTLGVGLADLVKSGVGKIRDLGAAMFQTLVVDGVHAAAEAEAGLNRLNQ